MLKGKRGILFRIKMGKKCSIFSILEVCDGLKTFSHQLRMQYLKLFWFVQKFTILWNQCERWICIDRVLILNLYFRLIVTLLAFHKLLLKLVGHLYFVSDNSLWSHWKATLALYFYQFVIGRMGAVQYCAFLSTMLERITSRSVVNKLTHLFPVI